MSRHHMTAKGQVPFTPEEEAFFDAEAEAHTKKLVATEYKLNRVTEYPSIGDQLDALFKAGVFPSDMAAMIQAVKDKYPKD